MADIAELGFEVNSAQLRQASTDADRLSASARQLGTSVDDAGRRAAAATGAFRNMALGIVAGVASVAGQIQLVKKFVDATIESENSLAQLNAAIQATSGAAGLSSGQLVAMADNLQRITTYSDDAIISAQGLLLRFDRIGKDVFPRALTAITDVAAATGKDLNSAVMQVGRALQDPIRGLQALQRAGIQFTQSQRDQIKALVESGHGIAAQKIILEELESRYKGAAEAARDTLGGALKALGNAFDNLFEQTNTEESEKLRQSIEGLVAILADPSTQGAFQAFGGLVFSQITATIRDATKEIERISAAIQQFQAGNLGQGFKTILGVEGDQGTNFAQQLGIDELNKQLEETKKAAPPAAAAMKDFGDSTAKAAEATSDLVEQRAMVEWLRDNVSALGSAATAMEKYQAQVEELRLKLNEGKISLETFNRAQTQLHPVVKSLKDAVGDLGDALADAFIHGKDSADALNSALKAIASTSSSGAIKGLVTGLTGGGFDITSIATGGLIGIGASLLSKIFGGGGDNQAAQQQAAAAAQAKAEREQELADAQVRAAEFNLRAAEAMEKSDFIRQLTRFDFESQRQFDVESKRAGDLAINALIAARTAERLALITQAIADATDTLAGEELSAVEQRMQEIAEASATLTAALAAQGEATTKAAELTAAAVEKLKGQFIDDLAREVNELAGAGFINQASDLQAKVAQLQSDAAALGISTALIDNFYVLSAQKIVDQNQLTGQSFQVLENMLGLAGTSLHEFTAAIEQTGQVVKRTAQEIAATIQDYQTQLFILQQDTSTLAGALAVFEIQAQQAQAAEIAKGGEALAALIALQEQQKFNIVADFAKKEAEAKAQAAQQALAAQKQAQEAALKAQQQAAEEQKRILEEAQRFLEGALRRIQDWITNFLSGPQSTLSPAQQLATAQSGFATQFSAALGGNRDALNAITGNAQDVVDAARRYYGSSATGQAIIDAMIAQLQSLPAQVSAEQFIVDGLTTPINSVGTTVSGSISSQTTTMQSLFSNLQAAVNTGSASAIASALTPLFNVLDVNTDGLLTFAELQQGLGATYAAGTLRGIFNELDGNGNGMLEKSELIRVATQGTEVDTSSIATTNQNMVTPTNNIATGVGTTNTNLTTANALQTTTNNILSAIQTAVGFLSGIFDNTANTAASVNQIPTMVNLTSSSNAALTSIAGWAPGSNHAVGGYISGAGSGTSDSIRAWLSNGEYVINAGDTAWSRPILDAINYRHELPSFVAGGANDNGDTIAAIRSLERSLVRGVRAIVGAELEAAGIVARPMQEAVKTAKTKRGEKAAA